MPVPRWLTRRDHVLWDTADVIVKKVGEEAYAVRTDTREVITHGKDHAKVIQKAIDHIAEKGGGKVYISAGEYNILEDETINLQSNIEIIGSGTATIIKKHTSKGWDPLIIIKPDTENITIRSLTLDLTDAKANDVQAIQNLGYGVNKNIIIDYCIFILDTSYTYTHRAIRIGTKDPGYTDNIIISNNIIYMSKGNAISFVSGSETKVHKLVKIIGNYYEEPETGAVSGTAVSDFIDVVNTEHLVVAFNYVNRVSHNFLITAYTRFTSMGNIIILNPNLSGADVYDTHSGEGDVYGVISNDIIINPASKTHGILTIEAPNVTIYMSKIIGLCPANGVLEVGKASSYADSSFLSITNSYIEGFSIYDVEPDVIENVHGFINKNSGVAVFSGDGSTTQFKIEHGLVAKPSKVIVTPLSADAKDFAYAEADDTYIYFNFSTAPPSGTDNVKLSWYAEV